MKNEANLLLKATGIAVTKVHRYYECSECRGIIDIEDECKYCPYCGVYFTGTSYEGEDEITKLRNAIRRCAMEWVKFWYKDIQPASVLEAALFDYTDNLEDLSEIAKQNILQSIDETYNLIDKMSKNENDT